MTAKKTISNILDEHRSFAAPIEFSTSANISALQLEQMRNLAAQDIESYWQVHADKMHWFTPWTKTLEWDPPYAKWFVGGKTNISYNCLERIIDQGNADKSAIIWHGEPGDSEHITYRQLLSRVNRCTNALRSLGVRTGDAVVIYMPMLPEAIVSMLACARIGAVHSVIFAGFSSEAIRDRVNDASATVIITADGGFRRGKVVPLKANIDAALAAGCPSVKKVLVVQRSKENVAMLTGRDLWWHDLVPGQSEQAKVAELDSEAPLYILYTSGSTGKPKGIVHTCGGYMVQTALSVRMVFDLKPNDIYWCTADIGWVTGHSYIVYGPLCNAATIFVYEGSPDYPDKDRFWSLIERYKVTIFYTAPTAIRSFMKWGKELVEKHDLSSLRLLGTVGEPINPEAWIWYRSTIGKDRCPIVDTWWQTETGSIMIAPIPGVLATKPGSATQPLPGIDVAVVDAEGNECPVDVGGFLVIRKPWPSMLRNIHNDPERFKSQYWSEFPGWYFTGDGARRDKDGYFWILGRVDDVINVAGHRLGTAEIESALVSHPSVVEAAVVGAPDDVRGEAIYAFVTLKAGIEDHSHTESDLKDHVVKSIGALARPEKVIITASLPKTRSGKIMRRLLRNIAAGKAVQGDLSTLEDMNVLDKLREQVPEE